MIRVNMRLTAPLSQGFLRRDAMIGIVPETRAFAAAAGRIKKRCARVQVRRKISAMLQSVLETRGAGDISMWRDTHIKAYRLMVLARVLDEKFASLYRAGKIHGGVFLGRGQE